MPKAVEIKYCSNCKQQFEKCHKVIADMGFCKIIQLQCPSCFCPYDTKFKYNKPIKERNNINGKKV